MDVAFMRASFTPPQGLVLYPLLTEPMIAALPANHPLAQNHDKPFSLKEAAGETFIAYARQSGPALFEAMMTGCLKAGFTPRIGQEAPRIVTALSLVAAGLGLAIVPRSMRSMALNGVVYRALKGSIPNAVLTLACRRCDPTAAVRNFVAFVRRAARDAVSAGAQAFSDKAAIAMAYRPIF